MVIALLLGILVGIVLAIVPGPVAVGAMKLGMNQGHKSGALYSLGSGFMDFIFCAFAVFATAAVVSVISEFTDNHPLIMLIVQLLIVSAIITYGFMQIKFKSKKVISLDSDEIEKPKYMDILKHKGPFFLGVAIALTNLASPTFLPTLAYVVMNVHKFALFENIFFTNLIFSVGFGLGNFLWLYLLVRVLIHYKSRMSDVFIARLHKFAGFTLIGFGTLLGYRVITFTKWPEAMGFIFAF